MISKKVTCLVLSAMTLSLLSMPAITSAQAADGKDGTETAVKRSEPSAEDLKNSKERGLFIEAPNYHKEAVKLQKVEKHKEAPKKTNKADLVPVKAGPKTSPTKEIKVISTGAGKVSTAKHAVAVVKPAHVKTGHSNIIARVKTKPVVISKKGGGHIKVIAGTTPDINYKTVSLENSDAIIKAWLNKPGSSPKYRDGEKMEVNVTANQDCNISIFDYDGKGKLTQIFPNEFQPAGSVRAGETITIGGADSKFEYQVSTQPGEDKVNEHIFIFAYPTTEAPLSIAMSRTADSPFRSADLSLEQYRKLVNESKVYFSREVKIVAKGQTPVKPVANTTSSAPNKVELSFQIEK